MSLAATRSAGGGHIFMVLFLAGAALHEENCDRSNFVLSFYSRTRDLDTLGHGTRRYFIKRLGGSPRKTCTCVGVKDASTRNGIYRGAKVW